MSGEKRIRVVYNGEGTRVTILPTWDKEAFLEYLRSELDISADLDVRDMRVLCVLPLCLPRVGGVGTGCRRATGPFMCRAWVGTRVWAVGADASLTACPLGP